MGGVPGSTPKFRVPEVTAPKIRGDEFGRISGSGFFERGEQLPSDLMKGGEKIIGGVVDTLRQVPLFGELLFPPTEDDDDDPDTAVKPSRDPGVSPDDVSLGGSQDPAANRRGKRQLSRPKG